MIHSISCRNNNDKVDDLHMFGSAKYLLLFLLPPVLSVIVCVFNYWRYPKSKIPVAIFLLELTLIFSYLSPIYDVIHTVENTYNYIPSYLSLIISKTSIIMMYYLTSFLPLQCMNIYHIIFFLTLYFITRAAQNVYSLNSKSLLMAICSVALVSVISLSFYTLAAAIVCYLFSLKKLSIPKVAVIIVVCFFLHKSSVILIIPSLLLYFIEGKVRFSFQYVYIFIAVFLFLFIHGLGDNALLITAGGDTADFLNSKTEEYTGSGQWGSGYDHEMSLSQKLCFVFQYLFVIIVMIKYYCNRKYFTNRLLCNGFCVNFALLIGSTGLYVLSERFSISCTILGMLMYLNYKSNLSTSYSKIMASLSKPCLCFLLYYLLSVYSISPALYKDSLLSDRGNANKITRSTLYLPSILLLDIDDFGFDDDTILRNRL